VAKLPKIRNKKAKKEVKYLEIMKIERNAYMQQLH
jgi:hypothetical protein